MKRKMLFLVIGLGFAGILCWWISSQTLLLKCQSDSLLNARHLLIRKGNSFQRGDIVCLQDHRVKSIVGDKLLAKRVIGLPGDQIRHEKQFIKVVPQDGVLSPGTLNSSVLPLLKQTIKGELLTPLSFTTIPEGYVFVAGDCPRSFDSRYEEFGLVLIKNVKGRGIWFW